MHISELDFDLPDHLVAQHPAARRDASRLMAVCRTSGRVEHQTFDELPDVVKDEIQLNHPTYTEAPPLDDTRPNDTTWTITKRAIDARRAEEATE